MRSYFFCLFISLLSQISIAQISMETVNGEEGSVELYAVNTANIPCSIVLNFTNLDNLKATDNFVIASPGRSKVMTLKRTDENRATVLKYSYSYLKGNFHARSKSEPLYLIPLPEGTITTGTRMTHIENRLQPREENTDYVGVSFTFGLPTQIVAPRKGVVSENSMDKFGEKNNLTFDREENFIELFHEDGSLTKIMVLKPGSEKVKLGQIVFPGEVIAESAGEDYNSGFHVRLVNMKPVKDGNEKLKYEMSPMKFISEEGESDLSSREEHTVIYPEEVILAEMSKREKKVYETERQ